MQILLLAQGLISVARPTALLLAFFLCLLPAQKALACDCEPLISPLEAQTAATLVFVGKVIAEKKYPLPSIASNYKEVRYSFKASRFWKGEVKQKVDVRFPASPKHCGLKLKKGETYLVYATGHPVPFADACSRTVALSSASAEKDIAKFTRGQFVSDEDERAYRAEKRKRLEAENQAEQEQIPLEEEEESSSGSSLPILILILLIVAGAYLFYSKKNDNSSEE